ncbi:uncharacterized protein [Agelaius tricolor]|uniref:uncharacterized protein isoform X2 n=1 Tax=Agelaius tricolor TaxID=9191 RepID=UPI0039F17818
MSRTCLTFSRWWQKSQTPVSLPPCGQRAVLQSPRASALPLAAGCRGAGEGRGCRARGGRGGVGKWPGGVKDIPECKRDTMAEKNGRGQDGPAGPLSAGGGGAVAVLRRPGAAGGGGRAASEQGCIPPEPAHAPLQAVEVTAGRKILAGRRRAGGAGGGAGSWRSPSFLPPALQGSCWRVGERSLLVAVSLVGREL